MNIVNFPRQLVGRAGSALRGHTLSNHVRVALALSGLILGSGIANWARLGAQSPAATLPSRLSDAEFWHMLVEWSEPNGFFHFDNLLSNERGLQTIVPGLIRATHPGGVYLGVAPEQNFTYIVQTKPQVAFIFDIRRGNLDELLLYKALFEIATDRADFVSRLFSKPRPPRLDSSVTADSIFRAFRSSAADAALYKANVERVHLQLISVHHFPLAPEDWNQIRSIYDAFYHAGPAIDYSYPRVTADNTPSYADLMTGDDGHGVQRSYLATEANWQLIHRMHADNLIVPLVGDFAGPKTIRSVATWVREHGATVETFYTSNVEQYLFQNDGSWQRFYRNCAELPIDHSSTFIRSTGARPQGGNGPLIFRSMLSSMESVRNAFASGRLTHYTDLVGLSHP